MLTGKLGGASKMVREVIFTLRKKIATATRGHHYIGTVWGKGRAEGFVLREPNHDVDSNGRLLGDARWRA